MLPFPQWQTCESFILWSNGCFLIDCKYETRLSFVAKISAIWEMGPYGEDSISDRNLFICPSDFCFCSGPEFWGSRISLNWQRIGLFFILRTINASLENVPNLFSTLANLTYLNSASSIKALYTSMSSFSSPIMKEEMAFC